MALLETQVASEIFSRDGTTTQTKRYTLTGQNANSIVDAFRLSAVASGVAGHEQTIIDNILTQNSATYLTSGKALILGASVLDAILALSTTAYPGKSNLDTLLALDPTAYPGASALATLFGLNPFSTAYELATNAAYDRMFLTARAMAQSGPQNVRGGQPQQALELAELDTLQSINRFKEVWANQVAISGIVVQAQGQAVAAESSRRDVQMKAQQLENASESGRRADQMRAQELEATTLHGLMQQVLVAAEQPARDRDINIRANAAGAEFIGFPEFKTIEAMSGQGAQAPVTTSFGTSYWR